MAEPVKKLLATPMSRKQFLLHIGGVAMIATGATGLIKTLTGGFSTPTRAQGYGSSSYGGGKPTNQVLK